MSETPATSLSLLERLVGFDTESSRSNLALIAFVEAELARHGVASRRFPNSSGEKAALLATIGPAVEGGVVLSGHTDVVPVTGQEWSSDPFRLSVRDGRAYGRGAVDMKGFLANVLALVPEMVAADLARPIHILFSYDEETTCLGCLDAIAAFGVDVPRPAAVIVGEPTSLEVADAHKGVTMCDTQITGTEAHSSRPDDGASAVAAACAFGAGLLAIGDRLRAAGDATGRFDPPYTSLHIATMAGGTARNVFAARARMEWEIRTLPGLDVATLASEVDALAQRVAAERLGRFGTTVNHWAVEVPPLGPQPGSEAELLGLRIARRNRPVTVAYGSEAGRFQAAGIPTILCGPGDIARAHKADEFIALDELAAGETVLRRLIAALSRGGASA